MAVYGNLLIRNFRCFDHVEFRDLSRINIISGANNVGKTAALEAFFLHGSGPLAGRTAIQTIRGVRGFPLLDISAEADASPWDVLFRNSSDENLPILLQGNSVPEGSYELQLSVPHEGEPNRHAGLKLSEGMPAVLWTHALRIRERREGHREKEYTERIQARLGTDLDASSLSQRLEIGFSLAPPASAPFKVVLILGSRTRSTQEQLAQRYSVLRKRSGAGFLLDALRILEPRLRGLEVLVMEGRSVLHGQVDGDLLPLPLMGEGMSAVADFVLAMHANRESVLLIDEIENGLHYGVLADVWRALSRTAERTGVQIIATTHSRECQVAAARALSGRNELRMYRLARDPKRPGVAVDSYDEELIGAALDMNLELR